MQAYTPASRLSRSLLGLACSAIIDATPLPGVYRDTIAPLPQCNETLVGVEGTGTDAAPTLGSCRTRSSPRPPPYFFMIQEQPEALRVKVPPGASRLREWYVERETVVSEACVRLGIGSDKKDNLAQPRMVGLAGPSGSGKSTVASMVVAREDVREFFHKGVLWITVGKGARHRLSALMFDLASAVYETVLSKLCRAPRKANVLINPEDGAAYIREVVDESSRYFLVVADDVWDVEVLRELKRAGVWVLYTTRNDKFSPEIRPIRIDQVLRKEAEMVLRRAAELHDDVSLPQAAYELMERCGYVVLNLALVGRWGEVRRRCDGQAWQAALDRIVEAQKESVKGGQLLSWRAAVLRAGLGVLGSDNPQNKELYLALAILPTGLAFPSRVAGVLLYGHDCSPEDLAAAERVLETLERLSILTLEDSGWYHVHEDHVDFVWACLQTNQGTRNTVLPRWRRYISSVGALNIYSSVWLVKMWDVFSQVEGQGVVRSPYSALRTMAGSRGRLSHALKRAAEFHFCREDWWEAYTMYSELRQIEEDAADGTNSSLAVAKILHNLGMCTNRIGKEEETEGLLQRALAIQQEKLGADHPHVADTLHSLGVCIREAGRAVEAEVLLRQALKIKKETWKDDPLSFARILHSLGVCLYKAGREEEAGRGLLEEALIIREEKLGGEHTEVANTLYYLGGCARHAGRAEQADIHLRRALGIFEQKLGNDHLDVAATLCSLGACAFEEGRPKEAEDLYQRALVIKEGRLGTDHPSVAEIREAIEGCAPPPLNRTIPAPQVLVVVGLLGATLLWRNGRKG